MKKRQIFVCLFIIIYNSTESEYRYTEPYYTLFVYPIITYKYHIDSRKIHNVQEEETFQERRVVFNTTRDKLTTIERGLWMLKSFQKANGIWWHLYPN